MAAADDDQQFCLRWNNHQSTLISVFDTLLEKGIHVDCTLAAEGRTLNAHKVVLSACSPYFEAVLSQQYDKHPIIILKDVKFAELRAMMDYMYRGEVNISQDQLGALLKAAESLQIKGLSDNKPATTAPPAPSPPLNKIRSTRGSPVEDEESRDGSVSPSRRRRKRHRTSLSPVGEVPRTITPPATLTNCFNNAQSDDIQKKIQDTIMDTPAILTKTENNGDSISDLKPEFGSEGNESVEDLTVDEEADSDTEQTGASSSNTVADGGNSQGFNWQTERSQDESSAGQDGPRDSQGVRASLELTSTPNITPVLLTDAAAFSTAKIKLIQDAFSQNNNVIPKEEPDCKPFQKYEVESDTDYPDLDDILLPDESEVFGTPFTANIVKEEPSSVAQQNIGRRSTSTRGHNPQFECRHCGKRYRWKSTLRRHESVECGGKAPSHACPYCVYRAKQRGNLGVHIRKHHNSEWSYYANTKLRKPKKEGPVNF